MCFLADGARLDGSPTREQMRQAEPEHDRIRTDRCEKTCKSACLLLEHHVRCLPEVRCTRARAGQQSRLMDSAERRARTHRGAAGRRRPPLHERALDARREKCPSVLEDEETAIVQRAHRDVEQIRRQRPRSRSAGTTDDRSHITPRTEGGESPGGGTGPALPSLRARAAMAGARP
jgi:hypothetical protein